MSACASLALILALWGAKEEEGVLRERGNSLAELNRTSAALELSQTVVALAERVEDLERYGALYAKWSALAAKARCEARQASKCAVGVLRAREAELRTRVALLERFETLYRDSRKAAGEASCDHRNVGPMGGFCLKVKGHVPTNGQNNSAGALPTGLAGCTGTGACSTWAVE
jgi:hypothetical protein